MDKKLNNIVENFSKDLVITDNLKSTFKFYGDIKDVDDIESLYNNLRDWFKENYKVHSFKLVLIEKDINTVLYHNGKEFNEYHDIYSIKFSMRLNVEKEIVFAILCENEEHYKEVKKNEKFLNFLFFLLKPVFKITFLNNELKEVSFKDNVTGVYNRQFLLEHLNKMLPLAKRENKNVAFLMIGIDHFKAVIDEFDYTIGDKVLIELANVLKENVRESDLVVRLDADEFLVVLANVLDSHSAIMVAEKLVEGFSKCEVDVNSYTGQTLKKTICIGVSIYPEDSTSVDQIIKNADISLYEARNKGRSQVLKFETEQTSSIDLF